MFSISLAKLIYTEDFNARQYRFLILIFAALLDPNHPAKM